eukprot:5085466-Amphidinium_carterae.1
MFGTLGTICIGSPLTLCEQIELGRFSCREFVLLCLASLGFKGHHGFAKVAVRPVQQLSIWSIGQGHAALLVSACVTYPTFQPEGLRHA